MRIKSISNDLYQSAKIFRSKKPGPPLGHLARISLGEAVKYDVACGTAATLHPGTQICNKKDADKLYEWIKNNSVKKTKKYSQTDLGHFRPEVDPVSWHPI